MMVAQGSLMTPGDDTIAAGRLTNAAIMRRVQ
jgi:hypothetical protein